MNVYQRPLLPIIDTGWAERALCAQTDPEAFFAEPGDGEGTTTAHRICGMCEVRVDCLSEALNEPSAADAHGFRGGHTQRRRALIRRDWHTGRLPFPLTGDTEVDAAHSCDGTGPTAA